MDDFLNPSTKVTLNTSSPFSQPAQGIHRETGEPVTITHVGDAEGMSPVYNVVDSLGQSGWVPQSDIQIIDPNFLPASAQAIQSVRDALTGASQQQKTVKGITR